MAFDENDIFDTPQLRYDKFRKEFYRKYLNPNAWDYQFDTKEFVQAYHDLHEYLEKTESFRDLDKSLSHDIPSDNVDLVLKYLPLPLKRREELIEYVVAGKPSQEEKLDRIKEFIKRKKENGLRGLETKSFIEIMRYHDALKGVVHEDIENPFEDDVKKPDGVKKPIHYASDAGHYNERKRRENEILELRQKVYSKLNKGQNVFPILKTFKMKVEKFVRNYRAELSYDEEKFWKDKVIITEKAVVKKEKELKDAKYSRKDETLAPAVKEMFDAVKAQELMIANLPEPPKTDEIESKLDRLKKFNKKLIDDKSEASVLEDSIVKDKMVDYKVKDEKVKKNIDAEVNDVEKILNKKKEDIFDMDDLLGKNLFWSNNMNTEEYEAEVTEHDEEDGENENFDNEAEENMVEKCTESKIKREYENNKETGIDVSDEVYRAEVNEFNNWYNNKLKEGKHSKVDNKNTKKFYDKIAPEYSSTFEKNMHDDFMYMQVPSGTGKMDEVVKRADVTAILALLQAVLAILIVGGKTLHEQSLLNARQSKLSQLSLLSHPQPEASLSPSSSCSCQAKSRMCCEVTAALVVKMTDMVNKASTGVVWFRQICCAISHVKEKTVRAANLIGRVRIVIGLGRATLTIEDY